MILQDILYPSVETCPRVGMYFKGPSLKTFMDEHFCIIEEGTTLSAFTYFNSFSIGKWRKYTQLSNLKLRLTLEGEFSIHVRHARKMDNEIKDVIIAERRAVTNGREDVTLDVPVDNDVGLYYFVLRAISDDAKLFGGAYETDVDEAALPDVKLAIGICTFKREKYVAANMEMFRRHILENPFSPMYGKLEIFISDNSQTLDESIETDQIHIFKNKNLGGSGGFTRSMIEVMKVKEEKNFTHIMMMDDDVGLNPHSIIRTYALLQLLKPEHKDAFIGGHMLKIDAKHIQSEAADHWDIVTHHPVKYNYNLEKEDMLIKNEIEDSVNYLGWWYCCMPISVLNDNNLPLPIFIKRDDIEFGLRNGRKFITLNGICVWHEPFEYKYATYLEYYYFRNMCIMNSRHRLSFTKERLISEMRNRVKDFVLRYRFRDAELTMLGIQHYLNGIDWFKTLDGEGLNSAIMQLGYKKEPIENFDYVFTHGVYENNLKKPKPSPKEHKKHRRSLNGWLLKATANNVIVPAYQPPSHLFYRAKKVINYEEVSNTAFITEKSYSSLFYILKMYRRTVKLIKKRFDTVTNEFRDRYGEITNLSFWNDYLFTEGTVPEIKSGLDKKKRPKSTKQQRKILLGSRVLRLLQVLLFWLPLKKKRVILYVHGRKGLTCNPKYIVTKLHEQFGDKLDLIWMTSHPGTCQEAEELGIRVVPAGSSEGFKLYLRCRIFITNDSFPVWALRRPGQKWINTWHAGMNYKHIGYDYLQPKSRADAKIFRIKNRQPNFYLSGSRFFTEDTSKSFRFNEKVFLPTGLARNDLFFENKPEIAAKVRTYYGIDADTKMVVFAPTFRVGMNSSTFGMDFEEVCRALSERFGGKWVLLFRNHNFVKVKGTYAGAIDVSAYHDMQELMYASDVLISDYSSCLYDFCFSGKPAFVYATDIDTYAASDRSFAYPLEKWPYPMASSNEELVEKILSFDSEDYKARVDAHLTDVGAYDKGDASSAVAEIVKKYCL
ncbi:MAG: hypothetical protein E7643_01220 [Ruminococcaceae bacterium]|nr:hypothetical protein [Oscillospiraceae bacterium]